jgi:predicted O-linked N-acetylglucosamine transferase (SPINDLY family)
MTPAQAYELAVQHYQAGRFPDAEALLRQILAQIPNNADALQMLGLIAHQFGHQETAVELIRRAIALTPNHAEYLNNLALVLAATGNLDEAIDLLRRSLTIRPDFPQGHNNLGTLYSDKLRWDEAIANFRTALSRRPDYAEAQCNLGNALKNTGRLDEAIAHYRAAARLRPDDPRFASNLLYLMHFHPDLSPREIFEAHAGWNQKFAKPLAGSIGPHENDADPDRPLRIGYVSPDFRRHPVGLFLAPLLAHHDRRQFEVHCFSDVRVPDELTRRLRAAAHVWHETPGLSDQDLAVLVRHHRIDILVDLTMHMEGNRLLAFARRPAPVQVTYVAYCGTTGLDAIDYRFTDPHFDSPDSDQSVYSEKSIHLRSYWCYEGPPSNDPIGPLPAESSGHITFGCLNNFSKVTAPALAAWRQILHAVPNSRLVLHTGDGSHRDDVATALAAPGRIDFVSRLSVDDYFAQWKRIDIALDPFPYPGGTTSCDALWMGAAVVSLAGQTAVSRAGRSILTTLGHRELVADTVDQYVALAATLASDRSRLQALRQSLRPQMESSPLMQPAAFADDVEAAYRSVWRTWCASRY